MIAGLSGHVAFRLSLEHEHTGTCDRIPRQTSQRWVETKQSVSPHKASWVQLNGASGAKKSNGRLSSRVLWVRAGFLA